MKHLRPLRDPDIAGKSSVFLVEVLDHDFDLVILDTEMDGVDGREMLGFLRQMRPKLPVLFLHRAEDGVSDVVQKGGGPVGVLVRTVDEATVMRAAERLVLKASGQESRMPSPH